MALAGYDRWYVSAHSLGSVIAFSGLMTPDGLIPRYLDESRWRRLQDNTHNGGSGLVYSDRDQIPDDTNVAPVSWLPPDGCVSRVRLLERMAGLVTYGCPLDKFAMLWPATIPLARSQEAVAGKPWLNFYDVTDPVAAHLDSFGTVGDKLAELKPVNVSYAASRIPLWSHLRYLTVPGKDDDAARNSLGTRLARWILGTDRDFTPGEGRRRCPERAPTAVANA